MFLSPQIITLVVALFASCLQQASAHSPAPRLLKRVASPSTLSLEILPRTRPLSPDFSLNTKRQLSQPPNALRYDDSFRLILSAFDETFHLHLRPTENLLHSAARINYYSIDENGKQKLSHTAPLLREHFRAYMGEVVSEGHSPTRMWEDAAGIVHPPHREDHGWVRIMVHDQGDTEAGIPPTFEGAFSSRGVVYNIMTRENYVRHRLDLDPLPMTNSVGGDTNLVIWRDSDVMTPEEELFAKRGDIPMAIDEIVQTPQACGFDDLPFNAPSQHPLLNRRSNSSPSWLNHLLMPSGGHLSVHRRQDISTGSDGMGVNFANTIGNTAGCPVTQKVLYMGVAADCAYVQFYGDTDKARTQILTNWNSVSALYKNSFNVSLAIGQLEVMSPICPTTPDPSTKWNVPCTTSALQQRLSDFSAWRGARGDDNLGLWHLMSGCPSGVGVGIAWLATLCQQQTTGNATVAVSGTGVSTSSRSEWQIVAHEIGHNFGAIHDCSSDCTSASRDCCPLSASTCDASSRFIMSKTTQEGEQVFSPCSVGNICSMMEGVQGPKVNTQCLLDPDPSRQTISLSMCGNGIVEQGEDCDPGLGVTSSCCDTNCKFRNNAVCDPSSSPCCTSQCSFAPAGQICRPSRDSRCDTAEVCTGNSSACPADVVAKNGQSCGSNGLACASGQCTSNSLQCQNANTGLNEACSDRSLQSCYVSCQDPTNARQCFTLNTFLIDGSPCGFGGFCASGKCQSAGFIDTAKAWYTQNLQISIPVTVVAGLIALILLWTIIRSVRRCCSKRRDQSTRVFPAAPSITRTATHERLTSMDPYTGDSRMTQQRSIAGSSTPYTRVPPPTRPHHRQRSSASQEYRAEYDRSRWVDDTAYNGPSAR